MAGGTSSPALGDTARSAHPTRKSGAWGWSHFNWNDFQKFFLNLGLWWSQTAAAGAGLARATGRALRLFWSFLLLTERINLKNQGTNISRSDFSWVKGADERSRAMKSSPGEMLNHIFTCNTLKWGVLEMIQEGVSCLITQKLHYFSRDTGTQQSPPWSSTCCCCWEKPPKTHTNHRLESTWIFQCWVVWGISPSAYGDSECGGRNVGLPLVCRRWAWTSPRSAPERAWAASAQEGMRISGCCDRCRWKRRARLWPGEWWHLAPGCTGFPFYSFPWNPCNLVQKEKNQTNQQWMKHWLHRVKHIPGSTKSVKRNETSCSSCWSPPWMLFYLINIKRKNCFVE